MAMTTNLLTIIVTAYCHCAICCGEAGQPTASGVMPVVGRTIAAPRSLPYGSLVSLPGIGTRRVEDRPSRRYGSRYDLFMKSHKEAKKFGIRRMKATIITK